MKVGSLADEIHVYNRQSLANEPLLDFLDDILELRSSELFRKRMRSIHYSDLKHSRDVRKRCEKASLQDMSLAMLHSQLDEKHSGKDVGSKSGQRRKYSRKGILNVDEDPLFCCAGKFFFLAQKPLLRATCRTKAVGVRSASMAP